MEAVLPIEVQIPSLRIMKDAGLRKDDWIQTRLDQLNLIDDQRLTAVCHGQTYQKWRHLTRKSDDKSIMSETW